MEKKNFLNPQELFNSLREMRRQAKENQPHRPYEGEQPYLCAY